MTKKSKDLRSSFFMFNWNELFCRPLCWFLENYSYICSRFSLRGDAFCGCSSVVEHRLPKPRATSSTLATRSSFS